MSDDVFLRRLLLAVMVAALVLALWLLLDLLLAAFASILLAVVLCAMADPISQRLGISRRWGLLASVALICVVIGVAIWLFGSQVSHQLAGLSERLPRELGRLKEALQIEGLENVLGSTSSSTLGSLVARALSWGSTLVGSVAFLLILVSGGIYIALDPELYRAGLLKLVPRTVQPNVAATLDDCGAALRKWLGAQLLAMVAVGVLTGIGLFMVGVPSWLALGLIAGLAEFVPYFGPIIAAIPGLLIAASVDWSTFWWALAIYVIVQQLENNILVPMLASRNVSIPAGLAIFAVIAMGILFGVPGLLLGFPLTVVLMVAVKRLYVRDTLGRSVEIVGGTVDRAGE